jgi:hypothetical protein
MNAKHIPHSTSYISWRRNTSAGTRKRNAQKLVYADLINHGLLVIKRDEKGQPVLRDGKYIFVRPDSQA